MASRVSGGSSSSSSSTIAEDRCLTSKWTTGDCRLVPIIATFIDRKDRYFNLPLVCKDFRRDCWRGKEIVVGFPTAAKNLSMVFEPYRVFIPIKISCDPLAKHKLIWERDSSITMHNGTILLPHSVKHSKLCQIFLPKQSAYFRSSLCGRGFEKERQEIVRGQMRMRGIPYVISEICIEGGNSILFRDSLGRPKAIIGLKSVFLSWLALEETGYFHRNADSLLVEKRQIVSPSEHAFLMARNLNLHFEQFLNALETNEIVIEKVKKPRTFLEFLEMIELYNVDMQDFSDPLFLEKLKAPVTAEERDKHHELALEMQAKFQIVKRVIATQLKIPEKNIAFVPQSAFHIDISLAHIGQGRIILHDEREAKKVISSFNPTSVALAKTKRNYEREAISRCEKCSDIYIETHNEIEKIGCKVIPVAGVFQAEGERTICFTNAIPPDEFHLPLFITNGAGPDLRELEISFKKHLASLGLTTLFLDCAGDLLTDCYGGLRCITRVQ